MLSIKIKASNIFFDYEKKIAKVTQSWEKKELMNERDKLRTDLIMNAGRNGQIYVASKLSSEAIDGSTKDIIRSVARNLVNDFYMIGINELPKRVLQEEYNSRFKSYVKAGIKTVLQQLRLEELEKVRKDSSYIVKTKR